MFIILTFIRYVIFEHMYNGSIDFYDHLIVPLTMTPMYIPFRKHYLWKKIALIQICQLNTQNIWNFIIVLFIQNVICNG